VLLFLSLSVFWWSNQGQRERKDVAGGDRIYPGHVRKSGTVTSTMRRAAHPSGCAGVGCSAMEYQSLKQGLTDAALPVSFNLLVIDGWTQRERM